MGITSAKWVTLHRVRAFCAVAEQCSWLKAAELLGGSQDPRSVWRAVEEFRTDVYGANAPDLFRKRTRGSGPLELTLEGIRAYGVSKRLVSAAIELHELSSVSKEKIRMGCYPAHVRRVSAGLLNFSKLFGQEIELELIVDDERRRAEGATAFEELERGDIDILIAGQNPLQTAQFRSVDLYSWQLVGVTSRHAEFSRLFRAKQLLTPSELEDLPLLLSPLGHASRRFVDEAFSQESIVPIVRHQSRSTETLVAMADAGIGIAILPDDALWDRSRLKLPFVGSHCGGTHQVHVRNDESRQAVSALLGQLLGAVAGV
jgi:DNA-binding transcriptional LysR family regulator